MEYSGASWPQPHELLPISRFIQPEICLQPGPKGGLFIVRIVLYIDLTDTYLFLFTQTVKASARTTKCWCLQARSAVKDGYRTLAEGSVLEVGL